MTNDDFDAPPQDDSGAPPTKPWMGIALLALLLVSFGLRAWDASQGLNAKRYYDERFPLKNVSGILLHGEIRPRHAFYLSLSYLPQTAALAASQWLFDVTATSRSRSSALRATATPPPPT